MSSNWDDWDDEPVNTSKSNTFTDDWDEKPSKPTRKQSFTDTWGDDEDKKSNQNSKSSTSYYDEWDDVPKKNTKTSVVDDWDDEPIQTKKTVKSQQTSSFDDWDDEPKVSTNIHSNKNSNDHEYDDWDDEPTTNKKVTKSDEPSIDDWDLPVSTSKSTPSTSNKNSNKQEKVDDPFDDWNTPSEPIKTMSTKHEDDWDNASQKKMTTKSRSNDEIKPKVYKSKLSYAEMEAQKFNIRSKKGRIAHQDSNKVNKKDVSSDDDWDDSSKKNQKDDDDDDFDWSTSGATSKKVTQSNEVLNEPEHFEYDEQWKREKQSKATLGDIFSSIQTSYNNPQEMKKNIYSAGKILNSATSSVFSSLSNWVSNTMTSLNTDAPITINGKVYVLKRKLGEGGFATVYLASEHHENDLFSFNTAKEEEYAMKKIICNNQSIVADTEKEIKVLQDCQHKYILELLGYTTVSEPNMEGMDYYLLTPYYSQGTVWSIIEYYNKEYTKIWPFNEKRCLTIFKSVCIATKYMHDHGYCHRDIKPHNIMLNTDSHGNEYGILIDLGSAQPINININDRKQANDLKEMSEKYCSAAYRAPELYDPRRGMKLNGCVDIWSLGCTLYAMAFGTSPFESSIEGVMTLAILDGKITFPDNNTYHCAPFSKPFCKFIKMMLNPNYEERIDIDDVLHKTDLLLDHCE